VAVGVLLTLCAVLHEANHPHVVQVIRRDGSYWVDRAEGDPIEPADLLVLRTQVALYTANLRANANVVHDVVTSCDPLPKTLVLDLSRQPKVSSTILDGLREFDTEMAGLGIRVVFAALPDSACDTARRWPWWQELAAQGRYAATLTDAVGPNSH
jgi:hypothetical protein